MSAFFAMLGKLLGESRWFLGLSAAALFGLGWLGAYITNRVETRMREVTAAVAPAETPTPAEPDSRPRISTGPLGLTLRTGRGSVEVSWLDRPLTLLSVRVQPKIELPQDRGNARRMAFLRGVGGAAMDFSSTAIELAFWRHPFFVLIVAAWAIARGSAGVAGELERGTMDLVLSRPIPRASFLAAQVVAAVTGLMVLAACLGAGGLWAGRTYPLESPPTPTALALPALNLAALGLAIYGYTLVISSLDRVRWRPSLFGSVLTLAGFIALIVATTPPLEESWGWLEHVSIFKAFDPVEAGVKGENVAFNTGVLSAIGLGGLTVAFLAFSLRDLPTSG